MLVQNVSARLQEAACSSQNISDPVSLREFTSKDFFSFSLMLLYSVVKSQFSSLTEFLSRKHSEYVSKL